MFFSVISSHLREKWRLLRGVVGVVPDEGRRKRHGHNSQRTTLQHCQESDDFLSDRKRVCCPSLAGGRENGVGMYRTGLR